MVDDWSWISNRYLGSGLGSGGDGGGLGGLGGGDGGGSGGQLSEACITISILNNILSIITMQFIQMKGSEPEWANPKFKCRGIVQKTWTKFQNFQKINVNFLQLMKHILNIVSRLRGKAKSTFVG